ncbi:MAG: Mut7-C RNAse domain-containing protein [Candidatus Cloacimonetes bacterium]|nr:Mut7-C RNAse domain-containing protein [Candidatus Cloacimonadota bacterium]MCF7815325.1 Mut7-C RNAse domain-containing protein [Candidatus Cloacimonadota bacterium]MCF7883312.1 Mut7-C RNAse domain-containing protein [Candidatus Cloacimonadota bacterium]
MTQLKPRFLLDENLNRLAKWLRMLGYDAAVYKRISVQKQINLAIKERRLILTRNRKTAKSALKFNRVLIAEDNHIKQLQEIIDMIRYDEDLIFSRCLDCNKLLFDIDKKKIEELVPEYVFKNFHEFKVCRRCGRIFWQGSHFDDMKNKLLQLFSFK